MFTRQVDEPFHVLYADFVVPLPRWASSGPRGPSSVIMEHNSRSEHFKHFASPWERSYSTPHPTRHIRVQGTGESNREGDDSTVSRRHTAEQLGPPAPGDLAGRKEQRVGHHGI